MLREFRPRIARPLARKPDFVLYTDAAILENRVAAALFRRQDTLHPKIGILAVSQVPKYWETKFSRGNMIYGLEMMALLAFIFAMRHRLSGKSINICIDNNNALCSLIRGRLGRPDNCTHVCHLLEGFTSHGH